MAGREDFAVKEPDLLDFETHFSHNAEAHEPSEVANEIEVGQFLDLEADTFEFFPNTAAVIAAEMAKVGVQIRKNFLTGGNE